MLLFIDFEASSLSDRSWPIEIGFAWIGVDEAVHSTGRLIRPDPSWDEADWSPASAAVHGIPRPALAIAMPAAEVADWAREMIGEAVLLSDAPTFDQRWLDRLLAAGGISEGPKIHDLDAAAADTFSARSLDEEGAILAFYKALDRTPHPHRAEADARGLAEAWAAAETVKRRQAENGSRRPD
ncbi:hypothetical protein [Pontivivens ytuae]|uniref:Exonuclease domain-containing protein n=1 Tax=Pontivivens ytuae TaxID=2789856 RepID=A0A7S9QE43_9RHOB|nr:hypothetical protein [Pontivivens ytuae]QPH55658.1 hypothetical protein I0K15_08000 [Pontivivens ytuae]